MIKNKFQGFSNPMCMDKFAGQLKTAAAAVYSGHRYACELDEKIDPDAVPFERELTQIAPEPVWNTFWQE